MIKFSEVFQKVNLTRIIGAVFLIIALLCGIFGYINQHSEFYIPEPFIADFYANVSAELASIAITVLIIDYLNERRAVQQEKEHLILQMGSPINSATREAIRILRAKNWLFDGSLKEANLSWANLQDAYLSGVKMSSVNLHRANLKGAHLQKSDLEGAIVNDSQLAKARFLSKAIMPDGRRYDGRFNLPGDLAWVRHELNIQPDDKKGMADFYLVSVETYEQGQEWAAQNLENFNIAESPQPPPESNNLTLTASNEQNRKQLNNIVLVAVGLFVGFFVAKFVKE